jgi:endonuclease YncB( thermonuclease family)
MGEFVRFKKRHPTPWIYRRTRIFGLTRSWLIKLTIPAILLLILLAGLLANKFGHQSAGPINSQGQAAIFVTDGDTIRSGGYLYRLVGFDTAESGSLARCERERTLAAAATRRLQELVSSGNVTLERVACACRAGTEETEACNHGRRCGVLKVVGRDVGSILISEGLARPYNCGATSCPRRKSWCD